MVLVLALLSATVPASAQFYAIVSAGYSIGFPDEYLGLKPRSGASGVYDALATGFECNAGVGYMIIPPVGFELTGSYMAGSETDKFAYGTGSAPATYSLSLPAVMPRLVVSVRLSPLVHLYTKFGPYLAFPSLEEYSESGPDGIVIDENGNPVGEYRATYEGGLAFGYGSCAGISVKRGRTDLFAEVSFVNAGWGPERLVSSSGKAPVVYSAALHPRFNVGSVSLKAGAQFNF